VRSTITGMGRSQIGKLLAGVTLRRSNPDYDPARPHHTPHGFRNPEGIAPPGLLDVMRWQLERTVRRRPRPPREPVTPATPELAFLQRNRSETAVTWLGHATILVQLHGLNILTDPIFQERASPFSFAGPPRHQAPPVPVGELPRIDAVLISHAHYDHLSLRTVRALQLQDGGPPVFFLPLGLDRWFARHVTGGDRSHLRVLDWWDVEHHESVELTFLPVQHWSARTVLDQNTTLWGAWAVRGVGFSFLFLGDLGYSSAPRKVGAQMGGFDMAAIPIGAYAPRWIMGSRHVSPEEAVQVHRDVRARQSFGIHWGTFEGLTDEPLDEPPRRLAAAREAAGVAPEAFVVVRPGEMLRPSPSPRAG